MTKVAYNACFGGFGLSDEAFEALLDRKGIEWEKGRSKYRSLGNEYRRKGVSGGDGFLSHYEFCEDRADPDLVAVIEALGDRANGFCAKLRIEDVPSGTSYRIDEYDGSESVMTRDDYDWNTA